MKKQKLLLLKILINHTITANICAVRFSGVSLGSRPVTVPFDAFFEIPAPSKS